MQVMFNPKDTSTFASASLDRTVKVWSISQPTPNFTLEGHDKGVNCVDYLVGGDRPYLISGADDKVVKVWDYQTKACVQTLEGHTGNVSAVCFHPQVPVIITASEDGTVKIWHNTTYRLETSLNYGMDRAWALGYVRESNAVAIGYDNGLILLKLGSDEPVASMDASGKVIYAHNNDILSASVKALGPDYQLADGERLPLPVKVCAPLSDG
jgi:coatomer subunit beta'